MPPFGPSSELTHAGRPYELTLLVSTVLVTHVCCYRLKICCIKCEINHAALVSLVIVETANHEELLALRVLQTVSVYCLSQYSTVVLG